MASKKTQGSGARAAKKSGARPAGAAADARKTATASRSAAASSGKTSTKKAATTKAPAKKASPAKASAAKSAAKTAKKAAAKSAKTAGSAKKSSATTSKATKAAPKAATATKTTKATGSKTTGRKAAALRVRSDESPWTPTELESVRGELLEEQDRLRAELAGIEQDIQQLMRDGGDGSGDDDADTGAKTSGREQEFTVARNSQAMLDQGEKALHAIEDGTYGVCESCGKPIGKLRMQAQPRATLCVACKQLQERH